MTEFRIQDKDFTTRDWFAGLALQAMVSPAFLDTTYSLKSLAAKAYEIADAMLDEKGKIEEEITNPSTLSTPTGGAPYSE